MSTNKTQNYQLHAWGLADELPLGEVNENFAAIDAALGDKVGIVTGTYTGNGETQRKISLGFTPKAVFVCTSEGRVATVSSSLRVQGGLALPEHPLMVKGQTAMELVDGGFMAYQRDYLQGVNESAYTYYYWALQ